MSAVRILDCAIATYTVARPRYSPVVSQTDAWQVVGAAGIVTKVRGIRFTGITQAARQCSVDFIRRSTSSTATTTVSVVPAKMDMLDPAAQTGVKEFTTLATVGNPVATILASSFDMGPDSAQATQGYIHWDFRGTDCKPIYIAGISDFLCFNFSGVSTTANDKIDFELVFTEQSA